MYTCVDGTLLTCLVAVAPSCQTVSLTFVSVRQPKSDNFPKAPGLMSSLPNQTCCQSKRGKGEVWWAVTPAPSLGQPLLGFPVSSSRRSWEELKVLLVTRTSPPTTSLPLVVAPAPGSCDPGSPTPGSSTPPPSRGTNQVELHGLQDQDLTFLSPAPSLPAQRPAHPIYG